MIPVRRIMRANALSCLGFGALFAAIPGAVAGFLAVEPAPEAVLRGLGLVLIVNGTHLAVAAGRTRLSRAEILWFTAGDAAWVLATLGLIGAGIWIDRPAGIAAALAVGAIVAGFAVAQGRALRAPALR